MSRINIDETRNKLTDRLKLYISLIIKEYGQNMPPEVFNRLINITDYNSILKIYDYGEVSAYANAQNIMMPLCADKILDTVSKIPGYGINKNHKTYRNDNIIINNNTFFTYVKHIFISGSNAEDYYSDLLLHETMHFCGSGGGSVIKEGINELLTRMLAQKYTLRTNSCGYPKEVALCYKLMESFGEEAIIQLAFINNFGKEIEYLKENIDENAAKLYMQVVEVAEKEFYEKYYSHMSEFNGVTGIIKKIMMYRKIDYSKVYELLDNYYKGVEANKVRK